MSEQIRISCAEFIAVEKAVLDPDSACNTITLEKMIELLGPEVELPELADTNPHRHHDLVNTKVLGYEFSDVPSPWEFEEEFCIVTIADYPIKLARSMKPLKPIDSRARQAITIAPGKLSSD